MSIGTVGAETVDSTGHGLRRHTTDSKSVGPTDHVGKGSGGDGDDALRRVGGCDLRCRRHSFVETSVDDDGQGRSVAAGAPLAGTLVRRPHWTIQKSAHAGHLLIRNMALAGRFRFRRLS